MRIDEEQVIEVDGKNKKKARGKAVKSIKNSNSGVMAEKVKNTNLRAKVKTKTGVDDKEEKVYKDRVNKNFTKTKSSKSKRKKVDFDDAGLKKKLIIFLIFMFIGFVIYYVIGALSSDKDNYFDDVKDATVSITSYDSKNQVIKNGSGVIYKKDSYNGYIVTSYYTIRNAKSFKVKLSNDVIDASLLGGDKYLNIAVLSIDKDYVTSIAQFGNSNKVKLSDTLYAVGRPVNNNRNLLVTKGFLSNKDFIDVKVDKQNYAMNVLKTNTSVSKGDSGAPLCNKKGLVVGIVFSKLSGKNVTYAMPINDIKENLYMFEKGNHINRPYIGVTVFNIDNVGLISKYKLNDKIDSSLNEGVVVAGVKGSSNAYSTIRRGDVIVKVGNEKINNIAKFRYELFKYSVGDSVKITINRDGFKDTVSVVLGEAN